MQQIVKNTSYLFLSFGGDGRGLQVHLLLLALHLPSHVLNVLSVCRFLKLFKICDLMILFFVKSDDFLKILGIIENNKTDD